MNSRTNRGFTLIELMIVVTVVAILAAIALPMFNDQIRKSRRTDAQREMIEYAQALERFFTTNGKYQSAANTCGVAAPTTNQFYTIVGACGSETTFTITATPKTGTSQANDGNLTLTQTGARGGSVLNGQWKN